MRQQVFKILFWLSTFIHLVGIRFQLEFISQISKPLILGSLLLYFLSASSTKTKSFRFVISWALLFSLAGDILLLLEKIQPEKGIWFILGLASFLFAHLCYLLSFRYLGGKKLNQNIILIFPMVLYLGAFLFYLWPDLPGDLKIPVGIYGAVISLMALASIHFTGNQSLMVRRYIVGGALLFMLSDSLIALGKFSFQANFGFWIMLTYAIAQWALVEGLLKSELVS